MRNQSSTDSAPEQRPRAANSRTVLVCVAILYVFAFTFGLSTLTRSGGEVKDAGWTSRRTTEGFVVDAVQPAGPAAALMPGAYVLAINGDTERERRVRVRG